MAASGQGRWGEELQFPSDAQAAELIPILVVLDPTPNPKLSELVRAFEASGGAAYIGDEAWRHLKEEAGPEMAVFLEKYIREPLDNINRTLNEGDPLPMLSLCDRIHSIDLTVGQSTVTIERDDAGESTEPADLVPEDGGDFLPGMDR